jgi:DNA-binding MarR family transcriptional regulator
MDIAAFNRLSRQLRTIAVSSTAVGDGTSIAAGQLLIIEDIFLHNATVMNDIVLRTGLAQSYVSKTVATLLAENFITLEPSKKDQRKKIITINPIARKQVTNVQARMPITPYLRQAFPTYNDEKIDELEHLLGTLSKLVSDTPREPSSPHG